MTDLASLGEENRAAKAEKGKSVYVGQWDSIKEKMV
jgi:hypothetical protein